MNVKTKKISSGRVVRIEGSGEIKEIILKEDFLNPKEASIHVCFKGLNSSGIVELNPQELEKIYKDTKPKLDIFKSAKVLKFKK
jgi:hypothetical protein